jgi:predicted esterase
VIARAANAAGAAAGPHGGQPVVAAGRPAGEAAAAVILVHGRGATAESMLDLAAALERPDLAYLAPQAAADTRYPRSWYPQSFMAPLAANEPGLSSALGVLAGLVERLAAAGVPPARTVLLGFSQGACLALELAARQPRRYGGLIGFSGGLIGPPGTPRDGLGPAGAPGADPPEGPLAGTPVFLGCSDRDPHVPKARVDETAEALARLGARVTERIYPGMGHTVVADEIAVARAMLALLAPDAGIDAGIDRPPAG